MREELKLEARENGELFVTILLALTTLMLFAKCLDTLLLSKRFRVVILRRNMDWEEVR